MFEFEEYCKRDKTCPYWNRDCKIKAKKNAKCPIYGLQQTGIKPFFHKIDEEGYVVNYSAVRQCQYCGEFVSLFDTADNEIYGNICHCCLSEFKERGYPTNRWPHEFKKRDEFSNKFAIYLCGEDEDGQS
jgi:hypothetical protein